MIDKLSDLDVSNADSVDDIINKIVEKLNVNLDQMKETLSAYLQEKSLDVAEQLINIAPLGDYSKLMDDKSKMAKFLKTEASKSEHWDLFKVDCDGSLVKFTFVNKAVDDGESVNGYVFVNEDGKVRHSFVQGND